MYTRTHIHTHIYTYHTHTHTHTYIHLLSNRNKHLLSTHNTHVLQTHTHTPKNTTSGVHAHADKGTAANTHAQTQDRVMHRKTHLLHLEFIRFGVVQSRAYQEENLHRQGGHKNNQSEGEARKRKQGNRETRRRIRTLVLDEHQNGANSCGDLKFSRHW